MVFQSEIRNRRIEEREECQLSGRFSIVKRGQSVSQALSRETSAGAFKLAHFWPQAADLVGQNLRRPSISPATNHEDESEKVSFLDAESTKLFGLFGLLARRRHRRAHQSKSTDDGLLSWLPLDTDAQSTIWRLERSHSLLASGQQALRKLDMIGGAANGIAKYIDQ